MKRIVINLGIHLEAKRAPNSLLSEGKELGCISRNDLVPKDSSIYQNSLHSKSLRVNGMDQQLSEQEDNILLNTLVEKTWACQHSSTDAEPIEILFRKENSHDGK